MKLVPKEQRVLLSLDLATTTGWASLSMGIIKSGTIRFQHERDELHALRFFRFRKWLREMLTTEKPDVVYFEAVRRHNSTDSAHMYGGLWATTIMECMIREIDYRGLNVVTIKKHATGKGNADKAAMVAAAKAKWPDQNIKDDNQADALWILHLGLTKYHSYAKS